MNFETVKVEKIDSFFTYSVDTLNLAISSLSVGCHIHHSWKQPGGKIYIYKTDTYCLLLDTDALTIHTDKILINIHRAHATDCVMTYEDNYVSFSLRMSQPSRTSCSHYYNIKEFNSYMHQTFTKIIDDVIQFLQAVYNDDTLFVTGPRPDLFGDDTLFYGLSRHNPSKTSFDGSRIVLLFKCLSRYNFEST